MIGLHLSRSGSIARALPLTLTLTPRYHYPSGRIYYTPLRAHMKDLVDEIIADAIREGFVSTRQKSGPKHVPDSTLLDPCILQHMMEYADGQQRCRLKGCGMLTDKYCPGCAKADDCGPASGFFCCVKSRNCYAIHHRKRARTHTAPDEAAEGS